MNWLIAPVALPTPQPVHSFTQSVSQVFDKWHMTMSILHMKPNGLHVACFVGDPSTLDLVGQIPSPDSCFRVGANFNHFAQTSKAS